MSSGIDVSEAQGSISWDQVARAGYEFVFVKAWEHRADHQWSANWIGSKGAGLKRGAYCFARPGSYDPAVQARAFVAAVGADRGELPLVLDLEDAGGKSPADLVAWALIFLATVEGVTGVRPILYTYSGFLASALHSDKRLAAYPLWIANYQSHAPATPWAWTYWQHSSSGAVQGIAGRVDVNVSAGTVAPSVPTPVPAAVSAAPATSDLGDLEVILQPRHAQPDPANKNLVPVFELDLKAKLLIGWYGASVKTATPDAYGRLTVPISDGVVGWSEAANSDGLYLYVGPSRLPYFYAYPDGAKWAGHGG